MSRTVRRGPALVAAAALALTTAVAASPAGAAPVDAKPGANWLAGQLTNGLIHNTQYDFDDYGLSIDTALALDAVGQRPAVVTQITSKVAAQIDAYTTYQPYYPDPAEHVSSGGVAKAAVLARAAGQDASAFGGRDLVTELESMTLPTGRAQDVVPALPDPAPQYPDADYANTIGQAFAARALVEAGSSKAEAATDFLLAQQCASGAFRVNFATVDAAEQGCVDGAAGSEADTDATALAMINLKESGANRPEVSDALAKAGAWLARTQRANGSFGGGVDTAAANANSTGLAAWALGSVGRLSQARKAAVWVRTLQPADLGACRSKLTKDAGAVAYDAAALKAGRKDGVTDATRDQWRRTTAQAVPALVWAPAATAKDSVKVVTKKVKRGKKVTFAVRGLAQGENACVSFGKQAKRVKGNGKVLKVALKAPRKTGKVAVQVRSLTSKASVRVRVVK